MTALLQTDFLPALTLKNRIIGVNTPCFVIAEAGVNHNGSLECALEMIAVAAAAGADAIKFQTFRTEDLVTETAQKATYQKSGADDKQTQFSLLKQLELSPDDFISLQKRCNDCGIIFLSTPFDPLSADFLDQLGIEAFKISSGDLTNLPFLDQIARIGKPMIVSTGMATLEDVASAVDTVHSTANRQLALLHCTSAYPANPHDVNLKAMNTLKREFYVPVGFSDHTMGLEIALAAVALGANIVEKHFTLDRASKGPDHKASLEPPELTAMIRGIRNVEKAFGDGIKRPAASETDVAIIARKSLVAACDIPVDTVLSPDMIEIKRPGTGLPPSEIKNVIGKKTTRAITAGTALVWNLLT
ncbi:MAG: N-acetylneuraminate synthase [Rhodospirillales bacterium]